MIHNVLVAAAPGRCRAGDRRPGHRPHRRRTDDRRRSRWGSGWRCTRRSVRSGPTDAAGAGRHDRRPAPPRHVQPARAHMSDPLRRLSPVVRLAPAKLNLTLAVVGRRDDGYHALHSVFVPLALADRLSLAPVAGDRDTLHVTGLEAGPPADNLVFRALAAARAAVGGGWPGGPGPAARPGRPAREADPRRGRVWPAGRPTPRPRWTARSRRGVRRSTTTPGTRWRRASVRTSRSSSPAARPWSRAAASRSRRCTGSTATPGVRPRHAGRRRPDARRLRRLRRRSGPTATARSGCRRPISPRSCGPGSRRRDLVARAGVLAVGQRPAAGDRARRPGARPVQARPQPAAPPTDRPVGVRSDPVGALCFGGTRPSRPRRPSGRPSRDGRR